jgi:hypothetical protein
MADSITAQWRGRANTLSAEHRVEWPVIDQVAQVGVVLFLVQKHTVGNAEKYRVGRR